MRLLICTQALDRKDPVLGFFVRWVEEFAKHCEQVTVICLRKGEYTLPDNVRVFPLGKASKPIRAYKLVRGAYKFRNNYDAVFVHMNPEYLVVAGFLWRLLGKRTVLWYTHKAVNIRLRIATFFAHAVVTASKESFRLPTRKLTVLHHGIDTTFFSPNPDVARGTHALSVGRLTKSKRHDLAIKIAHEDGRALHIAGEGPELENLQEYAQRLGAHVEFLGALDQAQLVGEYRHAAYLVHTSETGSLDKVVLEALACGCPIRTQDPALKFLEQESPLYVQREHSLQSLVPKLVAILKHDAKGD